MDEKGNGKKEVFVLMNENLGPTVVHCYFIEISIWVQLAVHNNLSHTKFPYRLLQLLPSGHRSLCRCTQVPYDVTMTRRTWSEMGFRLPVIWLFPAKKGITQDFVYTEHE